jgi:hypothetical protein
VRFSLAGSRCHVRWEKFSNFCGRLGRLTETDSLPSVATFGSRKLTELLWAPVGLQKLTNFHELPLSPTKLKYPTEVSVIPVV